MNKTGKNCITLNQLEEPENSSSSCDSTPKRYSVTADADTVGTSRKRRLRTDSESTGEDQRVKSTLVEAHPDFECLDPLPQ